jgi:hypothetical protein
MITETESQPGVVHMLSEIGQDLQTLVRQQLTLLQVELKNDLRRAVAPTGSVIGGAVTALVGGIIFALAVAWLLPVVWPSLPLWGALAIVGGCLLAGGAVLIFTGLHILGNIKPPPTQTLEGLKENLQWTTKK